MISANVVNVNEIISEISLKIQKELDKGENRNFKIRMGSFTGSRLLSGKGPDISIQMDSIGNIDTRAKIRIFIERN